MLLAKGFLPVSIEYRFVPEATLFNGPMEDAHDALKWARNELPNLTFKRPTPGLQIDGDTVIVVGWSTGGVLALSLGYTPRLSGLKVPDAILAFYCPTNYEAEWWKKPIYPGASTSSPDEEYDLLEAVRDEPFASYYPPVNKGAPISVMSLADERWRIILHMNWKAQMIPILVNGLPSKKKLGGASAKAMYNLPFPSHDQIVPINPYSQILLKNYRTPTFFIHGTADDLIPYQQTMATVEALRSNGVECGIATPVGAKHLFDTFPKEDPQGTGNAAIQEGYAFIFKQLNM